MVLSLSPHYPLVIVPPLIIPSYLLVILWLSPPFVIPWLFLSIQFPGYPLVLSPGIIPWLSSSLVSTRQLTQQVSELEAHSVHAAAKLWSLPVAAAVPMVVALGVPPRQPVGWYPYGFMGDAPHGMKTMGCKQRCGMVEPTPSLEMATLGRHNGSQLEWIAGSRATGDFR